MKVFGAIRLRVLLYKEDDAWIAQGLERDICAWGATIQDASEAFVRELWKNAIVAAEHGDANLSTIAQAPRRFFAQWEAALALRDPPATAGLPAWLSDAVQELRVG